MIRKRKYTRNAQYAPTRVGGEKKVSAVMLSISDCASQGVLRELADGVAKPLSMPGHFPLTPAFQSIFLPISQRKKWGNALHSLTDTKLI